MLWHFNDYTPKYKQIIKQIMLKITSEMYTSGEKLPSIRNLASDVAVNANTIQRALKELENIGLVYSQRTVGKFITKDTKIIKNMKINLAKNEIKGFLLTMTDIGFTNKEIIDMIENL